VSGWRIVSAHARDASDWAALRQQLWPEESLAAHMRAVGDALAGGPGRLTLLARAADDRAVGLAEATVRGDWVNGCASPPVLFLEGLYVAPAHRRDGIARGLVAAVANWGGTQGLTEFASDAALNNDASHALHRALGFVETERVVFFRRDLVPQP